MKGVLLTILCWVLVIVLLVSCVVAIIQSAVELEPGSAAARLRAEYRTRLLSRGGDWAQMLAQVAIDEYEELGDIENTGVKYCSHFDYPLVGWCCCFVYYCADICGFVEGTENTGDSPIFGSPTAWPPAGWLQLLESGGTAFTAFDATMEPQPGDIYFLYNVPAGSGIGAATAVETYFLEQTHIGIVVENHGDYCISTIDGNCNSRVRGDPSTSVVTKYTWRDIRKELYPGTAIYGFIRPNYPEKWTELIGDLTKPYYFASSDPDMNYSGHTVEGLTDAQIANIKNTIYGEFGYDLGGAIAVAQSIRDNVDRSPSITYDNFVRSCQYFGGYPQRSPAEYETEIVNTAFEYVFQKGGSAIQHPIFVFYAPVPADGLETDADFQALFLAELEFVLEIKPARFFSWHIERREEVPDS